MFAIMNSILRHGPRLVRLLAFLQVPLSLAAGAETLDHCDPTKVVSPAACTRCHARESAVWQQSAHYKNFEALQRNPNAKAIAQRMGVGSVKRSGECIRCHYTPMHTAEGQTLVAGVSCESCHGGARDWVHLHSNYGSPHTTKEQETPEHRQQRREQSMAAGMRNPHNIFLIARSCLGCHTVPNEKLVNVGGHSAGTAGFEFVAWSQGSVKHDFITNDRDDPATKANRLRVMYVVGKVADLEFSTRAVAKATRKEKYGLTVAQRAAEIARHLDQLQKELQDPLLEDVLTAFAAAELRTNSSEHLLQIADRIQAVGIRMGQELDGAKLSAVDKLLPPPSQYK